MTYKIYDKRNESQYKHFIPTFVLQLQDLNALSWTPLYVVEI